MNQPSADAAAAIAAARNIRDFQAEGLRNRFTYLADLYARVSRDVGEDANDLLTALLHDCNGVVQRAGTIRHLLGSPRIVATSIDGNGQPVYGQAPVKRSDYINAGMLAAAQIRASLDDAPARCAAIVAAVLAGVAPDCPNGYGPEAIIDRRDELEKTLVAMNQGQRNLGAQAIIQAAIKEMGHEGGADAGLTLHCLLGAPGRFLIQRLAGVSADTLRHAYIVAATKASPSGVYAQYGPPGARFVQTNDTSGTELEQLPAAALAYFDYQLAAVQALVLP